MPAGEIVAVLGFGASTRLTKPRDDSIGWTVEQRRRHLHLAVNNARFPIVPRNMQMRVRRLGPMDRWSVWVQSILEMILEGKPMTNRPETRV